MEPDVLVIGGGNAAMCAALAARDAGASVLVVERGPKPMRGGNTRHVRNLRAAHAGADAYVTGGYSSDEFLADLLGVSGHDGDPILTRFLVEDSLDVADWAWERGVRWQAPLRGTLGLARTNRFFLGGGKSLLNAYYLTSERRGVRVEYEAQATDFLFDGRRCEGVRVVMRGNVETIRPRAVVLASGGFESNREWIGRYWGDAAARFAVRGTPLNDGLVLAKLLEAGACSVGDPTRFHAIAVDARAPMDDAGILSRLDAIPFEIVVDSSGSRFYDEGEDIWPKRYAIWGRLIAERAGQSAFVIFDAASLNRFMPTLYPPLTAPDLDGLAVQVGLDPEALRRTVEEFNAHVVATPGQVMADGEIDDGHTTGILPAKSHWARRIDQPPFHAFPLRPGITFTYHGLKVDARARVVHEHGPFENVFAAGEIMAGNILTTGYLAGIGMTIGTVFGRLAGREAAA